MKRVCRTLALHRSISDHLPNRCCMNPLVFSAQHSREYTTSSTRLFSSESNGKVIPINIYKEKQDPVELPDDQYPEWLWTLSETEETISDLEKRKDTLTWENGGKRYFRLLNRQRIRENNNSANQF